MPIDLDSQILGMNVLEVVGSMLGIVSVWLTVRQNVWCWPIGILMVTLYILIFARAQLYADAGLQFVYVVVQFYGWYEWLHGGDQRQQLAVSVAPTPLLVQLGALGVVGTAALGYALNRWTDQALPYFDSAVAVYSLIAQWMLARKLLQNWLVWIGVDVLASGVYAAKELYATTGLYIVFLGLAAAGFREWKRSLRKTDEQRFA